MTNNFAFEVRVILSLYSIRPESWYTWTAIQLDSQKAWQKKPGIDVSAQLKTKVGLNRKEV